MKFKVSGRRLFIFHNKAEIDSPITTSGHSVEYIDSSEYFPSKSERMHKNYAEKSGNRFLHIQQLENTSHDEIYIKVLYYFSVEVILIIICLQRNLEMRIKAQMKAFILFRLWQN